MIIVGLEKPSLEDLSLQHFGVKGMQWGVVRNFQRNRQLNKASRMKDRQANKAAAKREDMARNKAIDAARQRIGSGQARRDLKDAKSQFKTDKKAVGSREARKKLNAVRLRNQDDTDTANLIKSGSERTGAILGVVGSVLLSSLLAANSPHTR